MTIDEWYSPRDIYFSRGQVEWLLPWLPVIREGIWPGNPRGTGYTDGPTGKRNRSLHASFETPAQIAAELESRLARCGLDRYLVEDCYINGIDESELARKLGLDIWEVERRINSVLRYIKGWKRKLYSFRDWKGHRRVEVR